MDKKKIVTQQFYNVVTSVTIIISIVCCIVCCILSYTERQNTIINETDFVFLSSESAYERNGGFRFSDKFAKYTQLCFADKMLDHWGVEELIFNDNPLYTTPASMYGEDGHYYYYYYQFSACGTVNDIPMIASNRLFVDLDTGSLYKITME